MKKYEKKLPKGKSVFRNKNLRFIPRSNVLQPISDFLYDCCKYDVFFENNLYFAKNKKTGSKINLGVLTNGLFIWSKGQKKRVSYFDAEKKDFVSFWCFDFEYVGCCELGASCRDVLIFKYNRDYLVLESKCRKGMAMVKDEALFIFNAFNKKSEIYAKNYDGSFFKADCYRDASLYPELLLIKQRFYCLLFFLGEQVAKGRLESNTNEGIVIDGYVYTTGCADVAIGCSCQYLIKKKVEPKIMSKWRLFFLNWFFS